jgi:indole-3-glycerol phosphate synthase
MKMLVLVEISVLTDGKYFGGSLDDLHFWQEYNCYPLLRKFIVDEYQILGSQPTELI